MEAQPLRVLPRPEGLDRIGGHRGRRRDAARVARQAPRRFRGNARPVLEDGLAGLIRIRERRGVDVDHDLVSLPRGARVKLVVESRLGEQGQRVRLLLGHRGRFRGTAHFLIQRPVVEAARLAG